MLSPFIEVKLYVAVAAGVARAFVAYENANTRLENCYCCTCYYCGKRFTRVREQGYCCRAP